MMIGDAVGQAFFLNAISDALITQNQTSNEFF
jgi:hypothetical protein